jgi:predicted O-methyltransferase YrrM
VLAQTNRLQPETTSRPEIAINARKAVMPAFPPRYFNAGELDVLVTLIASVEPKTVIEFGCNEGRAAATILHNVPSITHYVGIDVLPGYVTIMPCQRREIPADPGHFALDDARFQLLLCARGSFDLMPDDLPGADACFIDADHSRDGVLNDYALAKAKVRPGGIIVFHDDNGLPVVQVAETLDELYADGANIKHVAGTWIAFEVVE